MVDYASGTPCWVDLGTSDMDGAIRFYGELFGWDATRGGDEVGGYSIFTRDGQQVAGVGPLQSADQPVVWSMYVATDDAGAVASRVADAGGTVLVAPMDVVDFGRFGIFTDPAGAAFGIWQAGGMRGADLMGEPGSLAWTELTTRDVARSKDFYGRVFGWGFRDLPFGDTTYTMWQLGDTSVAGMLEMTEQWPPEVPPHWMIYFAVADCDASAQHAERLGGTVSVPPTDTPAGRFAVLGDPYGAVFSVIKPQAAYQP